MAKNYKETTTQAAVLRTSTKTLSFWCNIREAPLERFAELIEGNIRIALQDFSGGKGDKSKFAYFNLEISCVIVGFLSAVLSFGNIAAIAVAVAFLIAGFLD